MTQYQKPFLPLDDQIALLVSRGLEVDDEERAQHCLSVISYYRLSAYWYPFRQRSTNENGSVTAVLDNFKDDVKLSHAFDLYVFDKRLRLIILDALERIEIALRNDITVRLAQIDPFAHRDPDALDGKFSQLKKYIDNAGQEKEAAETEHAKWLRLLDSKADRSREDFATHFRKNYPSATMPVWIASELWDFGALSYIYGGLRFVDRGAISSSYNLPSQKILKSWIRCLNDLRNNCAHHSRTWNKPLVNQPVWPNRGDIPTFDHLAGHVVNQTRIYAALVIMRHFLKKISPNSTWYLVLLEHLQSFPENPYISLANAGFPEGWENEDIWK